MKNYRKFIISGMLFAVFIVFTILVKSIDVQPIGPEESVVGFANINKSVHECFGIQMTWYDITKWLGYLTILVALGFGVLGFLELVVRKSFMKVDADLLLLGGFYVLVLAFYVFFEKVIINYRPIIMDEGLEASFPSSHTMLVICVMATAMIQFKKRIQSKGIRTVAMVASAVIIVVMVIGRMISGVHWFTDIIGAVILSSALVMFYYAIFCLLSEKKAIR